MVLACCHPLIIIFDCENPFHPSGDIQGYFQFDYPEPIISEDLFILSFQLSFPKSHRCIIQYSLISSWSFVLVDLISIKYFHSFSNSFPVIYPFYFVLCQCLWWFVQHFSSFLSYQFIRCFLILPVVHWRPSQVCAISILILSTRISSMPNPLLVINPNLWRIRIM